MELSRFAVKSDYHIPGIASKLFKKFVSDHNPIQVLSYADRRWSSGNLYTQLGFLFQENTPPNYWYFKPNERLRLHRASFMKHLLVEQGYDASKSEFSIMEDRNYLRIYDAGSSKWIWCGPK